MDVATDRSSVHSGELRASRRRWAYAVCALLILALLAADMIGSFLGRAFLHPANLNPDRSAQTEQMLLRTGAAKEGFSVRAPDGIDLRARAPELPAAADPIKDVGLRKLCRR